MVGRLSAIGPGAVLVLVVAGIVVLGTVALIMLTVRNSESDETEVEFKLIGFRMRTKRGAVDKVHADVKDPVAEQDPSKKVQGVPRSGSPRKQPDIFQSSDGKHPPKPGRKKSKHGKRKPHI